MKRGHYLNGHFSYFFLYNFYRFSVIRGKFIFVTVLNSLKNKAFSNIHIGQISLEDKFFIHYQ